MDVFILGDKGEDGHGIGRDGNGVIRGDERLVLVRKHGVHRVPGLVREGEDRVEGVVVV